MNLLAKIWVGFRWRPTRPWSSSLSSILAILGSWHSDSCNCCWPWTVVLGLFWRHLVLASIRLLSFWCVCHRCRCSSMTMCYCTTALSSICYFIAQNQSSITYLKVVSNFFLFLLSISPFYSSFSEFFTFIIDRTAFLRFFKIFLCCIHVSGQFFFFFFWWFRSNELHIQLHPINTYLQIYANILPTVWSIFYWTIQKCTYKPIDA